MILGLLIHVNVTCWKKRHTYNSLRIRGVIETNVKILLILGYLVALFVLYNLSHNLTCSAEFWIMNTLLPFGLVFATASHFRMASLLQMYAEAKETGKLFS